MGIVLYELRGFLAGKPLPQPSHHLQCGLGVKRVVLEDILCEGKGFFFPAALDVNVQEPQRRRIGRLALLPGKCELLRLLGTSGVLVQPEHLRLNSGVISLGFEVLPARFNGLVSLPLNSQKLH